MKELLQKLSACEPAQTWASGKTWKEVFETCHRGDWLLWLFYHTKTATEQDFALLTIAKGHCANTVRHLMKDERSLKAVDCAMNYNGDRVVLKNAAYAAYDAAAYAAAATAAATAAARKSNQQLTADIVRQYIPIEKWNIDINLGV